MPVEITQFQDDLPQTDDFKSIVLNKTPLIDVRAPIEFAQGAFSSATNLPLMNDKERHKVGLCYKQHGNEAAVKLGHKLVNEHAREPRVNSWTEFMQANPEALLYCFRGGMRSKIAQQWLKDDGNEIVRLKGGYKAFRRFLIDYLESIPYLLIEQNIKPIVLAGRTGSGKTIVINQLSNAIDLEGLAHHRGSTFGRHATPQPTQIDFENELAMTFMRFLETKPSQLVIEDEGRNIGSVNFSKEFFNAIKSGDRVVVNTSMAERVEITLDEYVTQAQQEYSNVEAWSDFMNAAFSRIKKRLGGERYKRIKKAFDIALNEQSQTGSVELHKIWIEILLAEYYDPMYDYQMQKNEHNVCFTGSIKEVVDFLSSK